MSFITVLKNLKWQNILFLTVAGVVNAFGITLFLAPVKLYDAGISGTSMLLSQIAPQPYMTLSFFLIVLNIPLFLYGLKKQGAVFTLYSIYSVLVYSLSAWLITDVLPVDLSFASPLAGSDLLLCALFGGMISGIGSGMTIRFGGAMDGIEVLAVTFAKNIGVTVGTFVMAYNVVLYIICGFILQSWILPLYSIVTYGAALKTVDFIVEGIDRSKALMIITTRPKPVCKALSKAFDQGMTVLDAKGYYSNSSKTVIYFVVNRFQIARLKQIVQEIDPKVYISVTDVADILSTAAKKE